MKKLFKNFNPRLIISLVLFTVVAAFVAAVRMQGNEYEKILQQMELSQVESITIHSWHNFCETRDLELSEEDKIELLSLLNQVKMVGDNVPTDLSGFKRKMFHIKLKDGTEFDFAASGIYAINITLGYRAADRKHSNVIKDKYYDWVDKYFPREVNAP